MQYGYHAFINDSVHAGRIRASCAVELPLDHARRLRGILGDASEASSIPTNGKQVPLITRFRTVAYQRAAKNTRLYRRCLSRFCPSHVVVGLHRGMSLVCARVCIRQKSRGSVTFTSAT